MRKWLEQDVVTLGVVFFLIVLTWFFLGWDPNLLVGSYDFVSGHFPLTKLMMEHEFRHLNFSESVLGGAYISPVWGSSIIYDTLFYLGFSAGSILNLSVFFVQAFVTFLGIKMIESLRGEDAPHRPWTLMLICLFVLGFNPLLAWRIQHGHLPFAWAVAGFLSLLSIAVNIKTQRPVSLTLLVVMWLSLANTLTQSAFQIVAYSAPVFLIFLLALRPKWTKTDLVFWGFFLLSIFLFILPTFKMLLDFTGSEFAARTLGAKVLYSYLVNQWSDVGTQFFYHRTWLSSYHSFVLHEVHYPFVLMGLVILSFRSAYKKEEKLAAWIMGIMGLLIFFFSCNPPGIGPLLESIPVVSSFRIIGRANIVIGYALSVLVCVGLTSFRFTLLEGAIIAISGLACMLLPVPDKLFDPLLWVILILTLIWRNSELLSKLLAGVFVVVVLMSSKAILTPTLDFKKADHMIGEVRELLSKAGVKEDARIVYHGPLAQVFGQNITMMLSRAGIEGNWFATPRFNEVYSQASGVSVERMRISFPIVGQAQLDNLRRSYPVDYYVFEKDGGMSVAPLAPLENANPEIIRVQDFTPARSMELVLKGLGIFLFLGFLLLGLKKKRVTF